MILLDRVSKTYGKAVAPSLDRISLHVEPKEFVIVVGQSGAGKTTLLRLLTREERPTSGKIIIGGIDYDKLKDRDIPLLRRKIGVVFQDFKLLPNKTVYENVAFALEIVGIGKPRNSTHRAQGARYCKSEGQRKQHANALIRW